MKYKKKIKIDIRGMPWTCYIYDYETYAKVVSNNSRAETDVEKHNLYFNLDYLTLPIIRHELGHALIESYAYYNTSYKGDQLEEIFCSILEYYYAYINKLAKLIYNRLKVKKRRSR